MEWSAGGSRAMESSAGGSRAMESWGGGGGDGRCYGPHGSSGGARAEERPPPGLAAGFVMTEEQIEMLRKQIAVYVVISELLAETYKSLSDAHLDALSGTRLGFCTDQAMMSGIPQITTRQRWNPTPIQLKILEQAFSLESSSPTKERMKSLTEELSQHGKISESSVVYWFQNRRARLKKKRRTMSSSSTESELNIELDS